MKKKPQQPKQYLIILLGAVAVVPMVVILIIFTIRMNQAVKLNSYTFEDCVNAGNPVMESYPRQCAMKGRTYVEQIEENIQ